ncbi:MAG: PKD domain-containing protein [Bacteroidia bacterium]|nr:PKD domain-containing protein [Bacteroidia bacterium]
MKQFYLTGLFLMNLSYLVQAQQWQDVGGGLNNSSHCMTTWNGMLVDGGSFGSPCGRIAAWNGTTWSCFSTGVGLVARDAVVYNGDLIVVGDFWNVQQPCVGCNGVARWDGNAWQPLGSGFNNDVLCLTVWNGNLIAGGDFTTADGNTCYRVAMWNGSNWSAIGGRDTAFNNDVRAMTVYNGELWVGGDFSNVDGCSPCDRVVKWDGLAWVGGNSGVDIPGGLDSTVRVLYVNQSQNKLYMGGHFLEVGGDFNCSRVAVYDGNAWAPLGTGVDDYVRGIMFYNGNMIIGGNFLNAGGNPASKIAKWNYNTGTWSAMGSGMNDYVKAMEVWNGTFYAGGPFTTADGLPRSCIASWYETPNVPPVSMFTMSASAICLGQCISFTDQSSNTPTSWTWTFSGGSPSSSTSQTPPQVCYSTPGVYTVTLTACNPSGCNTSTQTVTVSSTSVPTVNLNANPNPVCQGGNTILSASGANAYTWSPSTFLNATTGSSVTCTPTVSTTYTVTGTTNGCTGTNTLTVNITPGPTVTISPPSSTLCSGSQNLTASGANTYSWSPATYLNATTGSTVVSTPLSSVTYTVSGTDVNGCVSTGTAVITVPGLNPLPLVEGFETPPFLPADWAMIDAGSDGNIWQLNTSVGGFSTSAQCIWYNNHGINAPGTRDEFRLKSLDFSSLTAAQMTFDVAYCRKNNSSFSDTLSVWISTDCGQTFTQVYLKGGTTLATAPNSNSAFTPGSSQWRTETVGLNSYIGNARVIIAFRNHNRNGNNLYIDNINITGTVGTPPVTQFTQSQSTLCVNGCINYTDLSTGTPTTWTWTFNGGSPLSSSQQNPSNICYNSPGTYTTTLTACNSIGCSTATQVITVNTCVGMDELNQGTLVVAPNPFSDQTTFLFNGFVPEKGVIVIRDAIGRTIRSLPVIDGSLEMHMERGNLPSGVYYFYYTEPSGKCTNGKLLIQ